MASGHVNRTKRPNTWLHRPMLQNVKKSSCQPGAVHTWHIASFSLRCRSSSLSAHCASLQLQPRIFSHQISSIGAVARSPHKVAASTGPCADCGGSRRAYRDSPTMSAQRGKADIAPQSRDFRI
jgi:hypothetical protein